MTLKPLSRLMTLSVLPMALLFGHPAWAQENETTQNGVQVSKPVTSAPMNPQEQMNLQDNPEIGPLLLALSEAKLGRGLTQVMSAPGGSGGGNVVAIRFFAVTKQAIQTVNVSELPPHVTKEMLYKTLDHSLIGVTQSPLNVKSSAGGKVITQISDALNFPSLQAIVLNEARIKAVTDNALLGDLGLHEIYSLMGIEFTGSYAASAKSVSHYDYVDFNLMNVPEGTEIVFTEETAKQEFAPGVVGLTSDRYSRLWLNKDVTKLRHIGPRTCRVQSITEKPAGDGISYAHIQMTGDSTCEAISFDSRIYWQEDLRFSTLIQRLESFGIYVVPLTSIAE